MYRFRHRFTSSSFPRVKALALSHDISKIAFYALLALVFIMGIVYAYFVNQTVLSVVARKSIEEKTASLSAEMALLEFAYMEKKNTITPEYASSLGMEEVVSKTFVTRNTGSLFTMRDEI